MSEDNQTIETSEESTEQTTEQVENIEPITLEDNRLCGMLAYVLIGIFWYFMDERMNKDEFVKFHVKQGILLSLFSLAGTMVLGMTFIFAWLIPFFQFCVFILVIIGAYNAFCKETKELPLIGKYQNKFKI